MILLSTTAHPCLPASSSNVALALPDVRRRALASATVVDHDRCWRREDLSSVACDAGAVIGKASRGPVATADLTRRSADERGADALTMRRIAERLGIRAPSLHKHPPDKATLEAAVIATGLEDLAAALDTAADAAPEPLSALAGAYREFALAHPHLYLLMTTRPLPRDRLPAGVEDHAAGPVLRATGDRARARAFRAFGHGMVTLELAGRSPDADLAAAWQAGVSSFERRNKPVDAA